MRYLGTVSTYDVAQRIGRRQTVGAVVHGQHLPLKRYEHLLRGLVGFHCLGIVIRDGAPAFDQRVEPDVFGIGKLHEAVEGRLAPHGIGSEALDIGFVLPVVALLQQREASAADHQIFERHGFVGLVKYRCDYDAAALAQQLPGQRHDEIQHDAPVAFGNRPHLRHDRHLLDLKRHHAFSVGKRIHGCKKECVAVTLEFYDLRAVVLLPLLPFGAGERGSHLLPLKPSGYRAAEQASERCRQQTYLQYLIAYLHG